MSEIILDLSAYAEETADIRLADGNILHLAKPTEALVIELLKLRDVDASSDGVALLDALNRVTLAVLNNNCDGVTFDRDGVARLPMDQKCAIIGAYTDFATRLQANPTTASPSSPETRKRGRWKLPGWSGRS